jgi:radical SAM protein with 4Fe4S-binding SPASM domain
MYREHDDSYFLSGPSADWLNNEMKRVKEELPGLKVTFGYTPDYATPTDIEIKKKRFSKRAICTAGIWACIVTGDGRVIPCDEIPLSEENVLGDVRTQSIQEIWDSPKISRFAAPPREYFAGTVCFECTEFDECHQGKGRCCRDSLKAYDSLFAPAPLCWKAPKGKRIC